MLFKLLVKNIDDINSPRWFTKLKCSLTISVNSCYRLDVSIGFSNATVV